MNRTLIRKKPAGLWTIILAAVVALGTLVAAEAQTATRTLPANYTAGSPVAVSIVATPGAGTSAYALEDAPPAGWVVSSIDNGGAFDSVNGKVKWGPFFDNTARTLGYQATPPAGTTGTKTFAGTASFDGAGMAVGGTSTISDGTVSRYALTLTSSPTGGGTIGAVPAPGGDGKYADGTVVTLTATANSGFSFGSWSGAATGTANSVQVTMSADRNVTANFTATLRYTLSLTSSPTGGGTIGAVPAPGGDGKYSDGTVVTLTATANGGFVFGSWSGAATGTVNSVQVTMSADRSVTANFTATGGSAATRTLPPNYTAGSAVAVSIAVTPSAAVSAYAVEDTPPSGWTVSSVSNDGAFDAVNGKVKWGPFFDSTARTLTYQATPPGGTTGAKTFVGTASFDGVGLAIGGTSTIIDVPGSRYTLTLASNPVGSGTIGAVPAPDGDGKYASGTVVTLTATAGSSYAFASWSGAATGTANTVQVTMSADRSVTANFTATGPIAIRSLPASYAAGSPVAVSIVATPTASISAYAAEDTPPTGWTVSGIDNGGAYDAVNGKVKWGPFFDNTARTLTYQTTPPAGTTGTKTFSGTASFDGVGVAIGGTSTISDTLARFALTLTSNPTGGGTIAALPAPEGDGKYAPGTVVTLTATANAGFGFGSWTGDASGTNSQVQVTMSADRSVTANFESALPVTRLVGVYYGLVQSPAGDPVNHGENGSITVKVSKKGTFTASVVVGGIKKGVKGAFDASGSSSSIQVVHKRTPLYTLKIQLQLSNADGLITGQINFPARNCPLAAKRSTYGKLNPAPQAGVYTMTIAPTGGAVGDPDQPQGKGYATFSVNGKGVGKLVVQPADGSKKFSRSATVAPDGTWPLFGLLHKKGGFMSGWITFATAAQPAGSAGQLEWVKPLVFSDKYFWEGFGMQCNAVLSKYEFVKGMRVLPLANAQNNARFSVSAGDLFQLPPPRLLSLSTKNKITHSAGDKFKMTLTAKTGLFSGSFPDPGTGKPRKFGGVILQKQNLGTGIYRGVGETGAVLFEPAP